MFVIPMRTTNDGKLAPNSGPRLLERLDAAGYELAFGGTAVPRPENLVPYADIPAGYSFWRNRHGEIFAIAGSGNTTSEAHRAASKA